MPGGRPSDIDKVISRPEGGEPVTVFERFVTLMRVGSYFEHAAPACGVKRQTAYNWLHIGAKAKLAANGDPDLDTLPHHVRRCVEFSDAVERATGEYLAGELTRLSNIERGGVYEREVTTIKTKTDKDGNVLETETTTRTETMLPNPTITMWRISRRFPHHYGDRIAVITDEDPEQLPESDQREALADAAEAYLKGVEDGKATKPKRATRARSKT